MQNTHSRSISLRRTTLLALAVLAPVVALSVYSLAASLGTQPLQSVPPDKARNEPAAQATTTTAGQPAICEAIDQARQAITLCVQRLSRSPEADSCVLNELAQISKLHDVDFNELYSVFMDQESIVMLCGRLGRPLE